MMELLKFSNDNAKFEATAEWYEEEHGCPLHLWGFSQPAGRGHSCPYAKDCDSKADRYTGKITDGLMSKFRCWEATSESYQKGMRAQSWYNLDLLRPIRTAEGQYDLIQRSLEELPRNVNAFRIHVGGDFWHQRYFDAWLRVAEANQQIQFYAYTKSLPYWVARLGYIPSNLELNASVGGTEDHLIDEYKLKYAMVVMSLQQALDLKLEIDIDERHAMFSGPPFGQLLHGTQPAGSEASKALSILKATGEYHGYSRRK